MGPQFHIGALGLMVHARPGEGYTWTWEQMALWVTNGGSAIAPARERRAVLRLTVDGFAIHCGKSSGYMSRSDLVKFARANLRPWGKKKSLQMAYQF